jgi:hypothetical protein
MDGLPFFVSASLGRRSPIGEFIADGARAAACGGRSPRLARHPNRTRPEKTNPYLHAGGSVDSFLQTIGAKRSKNIQCHIKSKGKFARGHRYFLAFAKTHRWNVSLLSTIIISWHICQDTLHAANGKFD